jgi:hypothetical protein
MKKKYEVQIPEVHISYRVVEAESKAEAILLSMDAEETDFSYSHYLPQDVEVIELSEDDLKRFNRTPQVKEVEENYEDHKEKEWPDDHDIGGEG